MHENRFSHLLEKKYSRRKFIGSSAGVFAATTMLSFPGLLKAEDVMGLSGIADFERLKEGNPETLELAEPFRYNVIIGWGDELFPYIANNKFSLAELQERSFGYNNDFTAFLPVPNEKDQGLLFVNHEYPIPELMYNDVIRDKESIEYEMAALGCSIVQLDFNDHEWNYTKESRYNRRITALSTEIEITGPAAANERMKTSADDTGKKVIGTFANCGGGKTPWKTVLSCEENFNEYFAGILESGQPEKTNHQSFGIRKHSKYDWDMIIPRFNVNNEPNEPNRFGWVVEIDPFDPASTPKKRTALGRFKHEGAMCVSNYDGRIAIYMADDEVFQHIYKFVTDLPFDASDNNPHLLDDGTLHAAKFSDDGSLEWLPLKYGKSPLNEDNGFMSQADIAIDTRKAAKLMGATEMDRPEGIAYDKSSDRIYVSLTQNLKRETSDGPNPKSPNNYGHILELIPEELDHTASRASWNIYRMGGENRSFSNPDNIIVCPRGQLWLTTDGMPKSGDFADGVFVFDKTDSFRVLNVPIGAEPSGPEFTPDGKTLFLSIQHPGEGSTYSKPSTRWPDFKESMPPRPAVIAISKKNNEII